MKVSPNFLEAHIALATLYYRLKRKDDGDREQAIIVSLNAEKQAREAARQTLREAEDKTDAPPPAKPPN